MNILEVTNLYRTYNEGKIEAVNGITFSVKSGELLAIVGESGSGKSTLLRALAGLEELDAGAVFLEGKKVTGPSLNLVPGHPKIKIVFQDYRLFPNIHVGDNILLVLRNLGKEQQQTRLNELLQLCKLETLVYKYPRELSGGEQQRVALARALASRPSLLLLDEPFSNLDVLTKHYLKYELIDIIKQSGTTALFVTHDTSDALSIADRIAVMRKGHLLQIDTPSTIYNQPADAYVARFFGLANIVSAHMLMPYLNKKISLDADAEICLRAESIELSPEQATIKATIKRVNFMGYYYEIEAIAENGLMLTFRSKFSVELGLAVDLTVKEEELIFFNQ